MNSLNPTSDAKQFVSINSHVSNKASVKYCVPQGSVIGQLLFLICSRKRLYPSKLVKYLGLKVHENLNWKIQTHDIATELNRANALLYKIRYYVILNQYLIHI